MDKRKLMWVILGIVILMFLVIAKIAVVATVLAAKIVAREGWNPGAFCEFAEDWDEQNGCYIKFAVKLEDASYCDKINSTEGLADSCRQIVSQIK